MSAVLIAERTHDADVRSVDRDVIDRVAPVIPIRPAHPQPSPVRRRSRSSRPARPVQRRAGSRGARYQSTAPSSGWSLTRRGALVLRWITVMATAIVVVLVVTAAGFAVARAIGSPAPATRTVSVQPGQSLWQLARAAAPGADVRDTVSSIRELNHLTGTTVTPGQVLVVPVGR